MLKLNNEHEKNIIELYASLIQPGGKIEIPQEWLKYVGLLLLAFKLLKIFTSDKLDSYIDLIIEALTLVSINTEEG